MDKEKFKELLEKSDVAVCIKSVQEYIVKGGKDLEIFMFLLSHPLWKIGETSCMLLIPYFKKNLNDFAKFLNIIKDQNLNHYHQLLISSLARDSSKIFMNFINKIPCPFSLKLLGLLSTNRSLEIQSFLIGLFEHDYYPYRKNSADTLSSFGKECSNSVIKAFTGALKDNKENTAYHTTVVLGKVLGNEFLTKIKNFFSSKNPFERLLAVTACGKAETPESLKLLTDFIIDNDIKVREISINYLLNGGEKSVFCLKEKFMKGNTEEKKISILILCQILRDNSIKTLRKTYESSDENIKFMILDAISEIKSEASCDFLVSQFSNSSYSIRAYSSKSLVKSGAIAISSIQKAIFSSTDHFYFSLMTILEIPGTESKQLITDIMPKLKEKDKYTIIYLSQKNRNKFFDSLILSLIKTDDYSLVQIILQYFESNIDKIYIDIINKLDFRNINHIQGFKEIYLKCTDEKTGYKKISELITMETYKSNLTGKNEPVELSGKHNALVFLASSSAVALDSLINTLSKIPEGNLSEILSAFKDLNHINYFEKLINQSEINLGTERCLSFCNYFINSFTHDDINSLVIYFPVIENIYFKQSIIENIYKKPTPRVFELLKFVIKNKHEFANIRLSAIEAYHRANPNDCAMLFNALLPEEKDNAIKNAMIISMATGISEENLDSLFNKFNEEFIPSVNSIWKYCEKSSVVDLTIKYLIEKPDHPYSIYTANNILSFIDSPEKEKKIAKEFASMNLSNKTKILPFIKDLSGNYFFEALLDTFSYEKELQIRFLIIEILINYVIKNDADKKNQIIESMTNLPIEDSLICLVHSYTKKTEEFEKMMIVQTIDSLGESSTSVLKSLKGKFGEEYDTGINEILNQF